MVQFATNINMDNRFAKQHIIKRFIGKDKDNFDIINTKCGKIISIFIPFEYDNLERFGYMKCQRCFRKEFKELI